MSNDYSCRLKAFIPDESAIDAYSNSDAGSQLLDVFQKLPIWLEFLYGLQNNDESDVLLPSAHSKLLETWVLMPLGLVHSAYNSLRTSIDIITSYTFYFSHESEWRSLCDARSQWMTRASIMDWHIHHTPNFREFNRHFGLSDRI